MNKEEESWFEKAKTSYEHWDGGRYERCCKGKDMDAKRGIGNKGEIAPNLALETEEK